MLFTALLIYFDNCLRASVIISLRPNGNVLSVKPGCDLLNPARESSREITRIYIVCVSEET